jgi:hypothetical protein
VFEDDNVHVELLNNCENVAAGNTITKRKAAVDSEEASVARPKIGHITRAINLIIRCAGKTKFRIKNADPAINDLHSYF